MKQSIGACFVGLSTCVANADQPRRLSSFRLKPFSPTAPRLEKNTFLGWHRLCVDSVGSVPHPSSSHPTSNRFMHASRLVQLAATTASQHRQLFQQQVSAEFWGADQFWVLSRARVNEWARRLKSCHALRPNDDDFDPIAFWKSTAPVLEEVFLAEVCTRVWCATLSIVDDNQLHGELDPIARSVFVATLEARRRALRLLLFAKGLPGISTSLLNFLRRDCEAWTDYLLASLSPTRVAQDYCFEKRRMLDTARRVHRMTSARLEAQRHSASLVALQYWIGSHRKEPAICPELNSEIGATIVSCLPASAFDGCGIPRPNWMLATFQSDMLSISILEDLCNHPPQARQDTTDGLKDRR